MKKRPWLAHFLKNWVPCFFADIFELFLRHNFIIESVESKCRVIKKACCFLITFDWLLSASVCRNFSKRSEKNYFFDFVLWSNDAVPKSWFKMYAVLGMGLEPRTFKILQYIHWAMCSNSISNISKIPTYFWLRCWYNVWREPWIGISLVVSLHRPIFFR